MIFEIAQDLRDAVAAMPKDHPKHWMLGLLEEAVRRDIHFIARHPTTMFQCMWNTCWWYDCPETAAHCQEPAERSQGRLISGVRDVVQRAGKSVAGCLSNAHQGQRSLKLCQLMEAWRTARDAVGGCPWLLSLRPPPLPLAAGQSFVLRGHAGPVTSVVAGPDAGRLASVSEDGTIRLWNLDSGREELTLQGPDGPLVDAMVLPEEHHLATVSRSGLVRLWDLDQCRDEGVLSIVNAASCASAFNPQRALAAYAASNGEVGIWDFSAMKELRRLNYASPPAGTSRAAYVVWLLLRELNRTAGETPVKHRWLNLLFSRKRPSEPDGCEQEFRWIKGYPLRHLQQLKEQVVGIAFSPDGTRVAVAVKINAVGEGWQTHNTTSCTAGLLCALDSGTGEELACRGIFHAHFDQYPTCVAFSPDAHFLAAGMWGALPDQCAVYVCKPSELEQGFLLRGHRGEITSLCFSLSGRWLVSGSSDRTVRLWDLASRCELHCFHGHQDSITRVAVAPDTRRVISASSDGTVRIWDARSVRRPRLPADHDGPITSAAVSSDGRRLATGGPSELLAGSICVWDMTTGRRLANMTGCGREVTSLSFSSNDNLLAAGEREPLLTTFGKGFPVRVYDVRTGRRICSLDGHQSEVVRVGLSASGDRCMSLARDGEVRTWDLKTSQVIELKELSLPDAARHVTDGSQCSPGFAQLPEGGGMETIIIDVNSRQPVVWFPERFAAMLLDSARGRCAGWLGSVYLLAIEKSLATGILAGVEDASALPSVKVEVSPTLHGHKGAVRSLAVLDGGSRIASGSEDRTIRLSEVDTGRELLRLLAHDQPVLCMAADHAGRWLATSAMDFTIRIWDAYKGTEIGRLCDHSTAAHCLCFSPDGATLYAGCPVNAEGWTRPAIHAWDWKAGERSLCFGEGVGKIVSLAVSRNGRWVISGSWDGTVRTWDSSTGACNLCLRGHSGPVHVVAIAPDGRSLASGSADGTVRIWDCDTGRQRVCLGDHGGTVVTVALLPGGRHLVSATARGVYIWDISQGRLLATHPSSVVSLAVFPGGSRVAVGSEDGTISIGSLTEM